MVSTRQSSSVASNCDAYVAGATTAGVIGDAHPPHAVGKLLRSGLSAPSAHHLPALPPIPQCMGQVASTSTEMVPVSAAQSTLARRPLHLLDLPPEILEKIFTSLGYKHVAHLRPVCRQLDKVCQAILNSTFQRLQTKMLHRFQAIKAKMPRRESARRNHPLACESDIIETLHMRLTLLQMTFGKHIERKHCCFFAGEILDEVNRILYYVKVTSKLARPYKVTDELFDLSTMAMEFFKEHIEPTLPEIAYFGTDFMDFSFPGSSPSSKYFALDSPPHGSKGYDSPASGNEASSLEPQPVPQSNMVLRKRIRKIKQGMKRYNNQLTVMRRDLRTCKSKIAEQQKQIVEYANRMDEYDKKNEETSRKFSTLLQELNKCKTELQYWRSKTPAVVGVCNSCGQAGQAGPSTTHDPEGLTESLEHSLGMDSLEFHTEPSTSNEEDLWKLYEPKKEDKPTALSLDKPDSPKYVKAKDDKSAQKSTPVTSKPGFSGKKRRTTEEDTSEPTSKKPKRVPKLRCTSKRAKN